METSQSDVGYPEQQPPEVGDDMPDTDQPQPQRKGGDPGTRGKSNDDGTATGNPGNAGDEEG
jgi:hypothetical protein